MPRDLNRVMIIGNVGRDPEMQFTANGAPVTRFSVAVNRTWLGTGGERHEDTQWFNVVAWNKLAETCNQYINKGKRLFVEGRLETRSWDGPDGQKRYRTEIIASDVLFLDRAGAQMPGESEESFEEADADAEELPF